MDAGQGVDGSWLDRARRELVDLVSITSFSDAEHDVVDHLVRRCGELGLPVRRQPVEGSADNLLVGWSDRPELLLTAHIDTIRPTWDWNGAVDVRDGSVYGLGAQDDKGSVVAALLGMLMAERAGVPLDSLPVGVGLCVDEERGGKGSAAMASALRPRYVVGLEGTGLRLGLAEGGFVEVWVHVHGRSVHGALRELGDNAIEKAMTLIDEVRCHPATAYAHPLLGRNVPMVWEIHGGQPLNVVPDACSVHLDWRVTPGGPRATELFGWLVEAAGRLDADVESIEVVEPFETPADRRLPMALGAAYSRVAGEAPGTMGMVAWTDAHNFVDLGDAQAVVFGPGDLRNAHRPDESVSLTEVVMCARVLAELLAAAPTLLGDGG